MKKILISLLFMSATLTFANDIPQIGAQVFIEPGQTEADVRQWIQILQQHHMTVCRIRMFEDHFLQPDGTWNFSLYDAAFDEAQRRGIKVFATLFPHAAPNDLGGPKFPKNDAEWERTRQFIRATVSHYAHHPALECWVLQNEPGDAVVDSSQYLMERYPAWLQQNSTHDNASEYWKYPFLKERYTRYALCHYLEQIAQEVRSCDPVHELHVNPHDICKTLPEYDFPYMSQYLTSLGASMHMSWHFWLFRRDQFPLGVSFMSDIIRNGACGHPFWVTELQGGNVTFSGRTPVCPSREDISEWLWTAVTQGTEGVIFWTLNQRATFMEAGEWGMVDFLKQPSDRLDEAGHVAEVLQKNQKYLVDRHPVKSPITLLYNKESFWINNVLADKKGDAAPVGRQASAMMRSIITAYDALTSMGLSPDIQDMERYDWEKKDYTGQVIYLANVLCVPQNQWPHLEQFVRRGGRLLMTGLTGYYDENCHCVLQTTRPASTLIGADVSEFKYDSDLFQVPLQSMQLEIPSHLWRGSLVPSTAQSLGTYDGKSTGTRNKLGKGEVIYLPTPIELGSYLATNSNALVSLYQQVFTDIPCPAQFEQPTPNVMMRVLEASKGTWVLLVNKNSTSKSLQVKGIDMGKANLVYGQGTLQGATVSLPQNSLAVYRVEK